MAFSNSEKASAIQPILAQLFTLSSDDDLAVVYDVIPLDVQAKLLNMTSQQRRAALEKQRTAIDAQLATMDNANSKKPK